MGMDRDGNRMEEMDGGFSSVIRLEASVATTMALEGWKVVIFDEKRGERH